MHFSTLTQYFAELSENINISRLQKIKGTLFLYFICLFEKARCLHSCELFPVFYKIRYWSTEVVIIYPTASYNKKIFNYYPNQCTKDNSIQTCGLYFCKILDLTNLLSFSAQLVLLANFQKTDWKTGSCNNTVMNQQIRFSSIIT